MKVRDQKGWAIEVDEYEKVVQAIDNFSKGSADRSAKQYEVIIMLMGKLLDANKANSDKIAAAIDASTQAMATIAESVKTLAEAEGSESYGEELMLLVKQIGTLVPIPSPPATYEFTVTRDRNGHMSSVSAKPTSNN